MTSTTAPAPFAFAGMPLASWSFAFRIWIAVVVALYAGFWLQLDSASSAAITVAILALPTRGQALEKAGFRLIGTVIGVVASIVLVGAFSQARDLLLVAFAAWVGLCVYAAGLSDGNRAYAAVLAGYTVALVAMQRIDAPHQVFDFGVERGAAIAVGIGAIALVNTLLVAPDRHVGLAAQLADLHRRVREYADAVMRRDAGDVAATAGLLGEIAALRSEMTSLVAEFEQRFGEKRGGPQRGRGDGRRAPRCLCPEHDAGRRTRRARPIDIGARERTKTKAPRRHFQPGRPLGRSASCCDAIGKSATISPP